MTTQKKGVIIRPVEQRIEGCNDKDFLKIQMHSFVWIGSTSGSRGGVAQSVEQGTHKPCVTGSIPVAATMALNSLLMRIGGFFSFLGLYHLHADQGKCSPQEGNG